jgi:DNA repair ATPase RecN
MKRMTIRLVCTVIILTLVFPLQLQASPGGGFLKLFISLVPKLKQRQNAYRAADSWLTKENITNEQNYQDVTEHQFEMNVSNYNNRLLLIERQDRDIQELHQQLKKHAHDDFNRYVRSEAINLVFANLSKSASFNKELNRFNSFITDADNNLSEAVEKLKNAEKLFWPDKLKQAHDTIKASREALKTLDLIGASPDRLKQMLETLDTKLDKLKESTEPKTLAKIRKELESAQEEISTIAQKTATIVEKVSKTEALVAYVSKSALDDPKVKKLIADISKREGEMPAKRLARRPWTGSKSWVLIRIAVT